MNYWQAGVLPRGQGAEDSRGTMCSPALHLLQFQLLSYQQNPKLDTVVRTSPSFTSLSVKKHRENSVCDTETPAPSLHNQQDKGRLSQDSFKYCTCRLVGSIRHVPLFQEHRVDKHVSSAILGAYT